MYYFKTNYYKWFLWLILFVAGTTNSAAQSCPTLNFNDTIQEFCDIDTPRIGDLVAIDGGEGIAWYASETGGSALTTNIILLHNTTYWVGNSNSTCAARLPVLVSISGTQPTDVAVAVSRCSSQINTIAQLSADGTNIAWYTERNGGTLLPPSTALENGEVYWVQQTEGSCTSIRLPTTVTIIDPEQPTGEAEQFFCFDPSNPVTFVVGDLQASGTDINWYDSPTSNSSLDPSTPLINNATYYATETTFPCESTGRYSTIIRIEDSPNPGLETNLDLCNSSSSSINLLGLLGGDNGGTWSGPVTTTNGDQGSLDTSLLNEGNYTFTYSIEALNACPGASASVIINVIEEPEAGENGTLEICINESPIDLFSLLGGSPDTGGTWSPVLNSGTGIFDPAIDTSNVYTYTLNPTTPCNISDSATITVTVEQTPLAGSDASISLCISDSAVDLFSLLVGADTGGTWSPALVSGTGIFDPSSDTFGAYTYTLAATASCPSDEAVVTVSLINQPEAGENANVSLCSNDSTIDLFTLIGGTPDTGGTWSPTLASGTGVFDPSVDVSGDYTYTISPTEPCATDDSTTVSVTVLQAPNAGTDTTENFCSTDPSVDLFALLGVADIGGTWSPALASGTGIFNPSVDASGDYTYTIEATAVCTSDEAIITVNVSERPFAGNDNAIELCTNDTPIDLFTVLGGTPNTNGTWTPTLTSGTGVYDPAVDVATNYTYTVPSLGTCPPDDAVVSINLSIVPIAGTNASIIVCGSDTSFDLFSLLGGTPEIGGTWSGPSGLTNGNQGTFNPSTNISGDYVYTLAGSGACEDVTSTVQVSIVNPTPNLPEDREIFCISDIPLLSDLIARVIPENGGTIQVYDTNNSSSPLATSTAIVDGGTYYISETDVSTSCEGTMRIEVTAQINDPQAPQLSDTFVAYCAINTPIIDNLNMLLITGNNVIWLDNNGNELSDTDALFSGNYTAIEEDINGCRSAESTPISVLINDNLPPLLNPNGNEICGVDRPTITELETNLSFDQGLNIVWYNLREGGSIIESSELLLDNTTYYAATYNNTNGCESTERLEIIVDLTSCDLNIYSLLIPDGFSPNGDGINDVYDLTDVEFLFEDYEIEIYNRYGNLVYLGNNSVASWDGTSNQSGASGERILPNGVYFYIFNFNRDNLPAQQGSIYLNR